MKVSSNRLIIAYPNTTTDPRTGERLDLLSPGEFGAQYRVEAISMGQSSTSIQLDHNHRWYNSVCFQFKENGEPLNIYQDPELNPYLATTNATKALREKKGVK